MGVAAYNRGTRALSARIDREQPSHVMSLLRDLSAVSEANASQTPFSATVARFDPTDGTVTLMNRPDRGWGEFGYTYRSVWELARAWRLIFTGIGQDAHSRYFTVEPLPRTIFLNAIRPGRTS